MIDEGKFGLEETISLIAITITVKSYFTSPTFLAQSIGTSSWYATLISALTALVGFILVCKLLSRFPGKNFSDIFRATLGKILGTIFSLTLCTYLVISNAMLLREFSEVLKVYILPLTPISFVLISMIVPAALVCFFGIESIARFARLMAYFLLIGYVSVLVLNYNNYDILNLFPIGGYGLITSIQHGITRSSFYGEAVILGCIAPSLQGTVHIKKSGIKAIVISGILVSASLICSSMAFTYGTSQEIVSRLFALTQLINIGSFFQRLDPLFILPWCIGSLISITFILYISINTYCNTFKMQDMRPCILPFTIIVYIISILPKDITSIITYINILRENGWIVFFGLPIFVLIIAIFRKKKGNDTIA